MSGGKADELIHHSTLHSMESEQEADPSALAAERFADAMSIIGLILLPILPSIFWLYRDKPLFRPRVPMMCITEIALNLTLLIVISSQYGTKSTIVWKYPPCVFVEPLSASLNFIILNITAGRLCLFYKLAQANTQHLRKRGLLDSLVHFIGITNAPVEFSRLQERLAVEVSDDTSDTHSVGDPSIGATTMQLLKWGERHENVRWFLKLLLWFIGWLSLSILIWYLADPSYAKSTINEDCGPVIFYIIGVQLIVWNLMQLGISVSCFSMPHDSLGLKTEILVVQFLFTLFWGVSGLIQLVAPKEYDVFGLYTDLTVMLITSLITFAYPIVLHHYHQYQVNQVIAKGMDQIKTVADLERLWMDPTGRKKIHDIACRHYAVENTLALRHLDNCSSVDPKKFLRFYNNFIRSGAPFEVNIPMKLRKDITDTVVSYDFSTHVLVSLRMHLLQIIFSNFRHEIMRELVFLSSSSSSGGAPESPILSSRRLS